MTDINFKEKLNAEQYRVMREKDTERPYSGKLWDFDEGGLYSCAACGNILFSSFTKFDADIGWPAFTDVHGEKSVDLTKTNKGTEVTCQNCHSHIGYLAVRGGKKEDDTYYRVNSAALVFTAFPELPEEEEDEKKDEKKGKTQMTMQAFLALLASIVVGTGVGYAAGTALCNGGIAAPAATVSPSISSSATPTTTPMPSPTPRPSPPTMTPVPTQTPSPTPTPTPLPTTPPASSSSGGGLP